MIVYNLMFSLFAIVMLLKEAKFSDAFNLSPKPNFILHEPKADIGLPKVRSSYFGFTLNLKQNR